MAIEEQSTSTILMTIVIEKWGPREVGNKRPVSKMVSCDMKYKLVGTASCDTLPLYDPTLGVSTEFVGGL